MTNEEILEAQELIANIRRVLTVLTGVTDEDKLLALVNEKVPHMIGNFAQLRQLSPTIFGKSYGPAEPPDMETVQMGLNAMMAVAEMSQRNPDHKAKLIDTVAEHAPRIDAILTNEQILDAEKAIASLRDDLTILTGTTDLEKLLALMLEKAPSMVNNFTQIYRLSYRLRLVSDSDLLSMQNDLVVMLSLAQEADRRPDWKAKLINTVAKNAPAISSGLDKMAQALSKKRQ